MFELVPFYIPLQVALNKLAVSIQIKWKQKINKPLLIDSWVIPYRNSLAWHKQHECHIAKNGLNSILLCTLQSFSDAPRQYGLQSDSLIIVKGTSDRSRFTTTNMAKIFNCLESNQLLYVSKYEIHIFVDISFNPPFRRHMHKIDKISPIMLEIERPVLIYMEEPNSLYEVSTAYDIVNAVSETEYNSTITIYFDIHRNRFDDEIVNRSRYSDLINRQRSNSDVRSPRAISLRQQPEDITAPFFGHTYNNLPISQPTEETTEEHLSTDQYSFPQPINQTLQTSQSANRYLFRDTSRQNTAAYGKYTNEEQRRTSFVGRWPHPERMQNIEHMVKVGFFYTGNVDLIRCHQCGIGLKDWGEQDDPLMEHVRYSPDCQFLIDTIPPTQLEWIKASSLPNNIASTRESVSVEGAAFSATTGTVPSADEHILSVQPRNPQYSSKAVRISSFSKWPRDITQTPEELAEAGFFYTGYNDIVRCYVCDGGLQKWSPEDNAWVEHARWFQHCAYVLQKKGDDFIEFVRLSAEHEQLEEEGASGGAAGHTAAFSEEVTTWKNDFNVPEINEDTQNQKDFFAEIRRTVCEVTLCTEAGAENAIAALKNKNLPVTKESVIDYVMNVSDSQRSNIQTSTMISPKDPETTEELIAETEKLRSVIKCLQCEEHDANCLFLPCAHHRFCVQCGADVEICPICLKTVAHKVKTFMS